MKKRIIAAALAMCFAMGTTSVMPVEAAMSPRLGEICRCGGNMYEIIESSVRNLDEKCGLQEHQSLSCRIKYEIYTETCKLQCSKCKNFVVLWSTDTRRNDVHTCISEQKL